ncbi:RagB/SusD family nutrient uptake outer membrane protein [Bacteroides rodentium]|jgi:hypothetical protein|uniref:RagB/SusD family nutrient uptake outer membrane protein n=1 Tax=Bacteroides rodentium TaxID=691816 RepID=UPI0004722F51|nr:RagB/SusD family nutrient uptake outer membrane protein [Bacteroides rodentium]
MKKSFYHILLLGVLTLGTTSSCDDYLEVDHYDILPEDFMYQNEANIKSGLYGIYDTFYTYQGSDNSGDDTTWGFKPNVFIAGHSTMDCQASGWDAEWQRHAVLANKGSLDTAWRMSYKGIDRANRFLAGLQNVDVSVLSAEKKVQFEAEARAIRAYNYLYLSKVFGPVPMLLTGETYTTSAGKARPENLEGTYQVIEEDLKFAMEKLDWEPADGEYGRITKGFCKAFLAELYMYQKKFTEAKKELNDIITSNTYALEPCYANLHAWDNHWTKESVFEVAYHTHGNMNWGGNSHDDGKIWYGYMCAAPEYGGWGSLALSWEYYRSFEQGDKRKEYTCVGTGDVHPITNEKLGTNPSYSGYVQGSENVPCVYSLKYWRKQPGKDGFVYCPISLTFKRYAGILLDYAECCFETGEEATGWEMLRQIRNRAWGNLEIGVQAIDFPQSMLNTTVVDVPDAKTVYAEYKTRKGYACDVWKVALTQERRHELNAEFSLYFDLCRMGLAEEWFRCEYPKTKANSTPEECWKTGDSFRYFEHQKYQEIFPIPTNEILNNPLINPEDQNEGY